IVKEKDRYYDRFNGRVIFPIHSISGQVIGFGGRILKTDAKAAKYLNSPESEIYHKSKVLYGLYFAKKKIIQQDKCYLVEGYTDVISLYQSGIENVVASSGTSLTVEQIRLIKRFTKNITILYDGDEAGIKASLRGIDLILEEGMNVKILLFPEGEDPDSFSKQHSSAEFLEYIINNEQDFINFKTRLLLTSASSDPIKKAGVITDLVKTISVIPDHITRTIYIKECSKQLEIEEQILYTEISKRKRKKADQNYKKKNELLRKKQETTPNKPSNTKDFEIEEREIIRLLLKYGNQILFPEDNNNVDPDDCPLVYEYIIAELEADNIEFKTPVFRLIYNNYKEKLSEGNSIAIKQFINHPNPEIGKISADLLSNKYILSKFFTDKGSRVETEEMKLNLLVPKAIVEYKHRIINTHLDNIKNEIKEAQRTQNNDELINLQQKYHQLYQINIALAQKLGGRIILD
ncbi:MAG: DNA primase, partial [Marinilabiliales bacterium]